MSIHRDLTTATQDLLRSLTVVDVRLAAMRDAQNGQPGAQRFDNSGRASVLWCWKHEREVRECERDDLDCDGETIELHDPAGEAALRTDRAAAALRRLERLSRRARATAADIVALLEAERPNVAVNDRAGIGVCEDCEKYCDGVKDNRLRPVGEHRLCDACRKRWARFKAVSA